MRPLFFELQILINSGNNIDRTQDSNSIKQVYGGSATHISSTRCVVESEE